METTTIESLRAAMFAAWGAVAGVRDATDEAVIMPVLVASRDAQRAFESAVIEAVPEHRVGVTRCGHGDGTWRELSVLPNLPLSADGGFRSRLDAARLMELRPWDVSAEQLAAARRFAALCEGVP